MVVLRPEDDRRHILRTQRDLVDRLRERVHPAHVALPDAVHEPFRVERRYVGSSAGGDDLHGAILGHSGHIGQHRAKNVCTRTVHCGRILVHCWYIAGTLLVEWFQPCWRVIDGNVED